MGDNLTSVFQQLATQKQGGSQAAAPAANAAPGATGDNLTDVFRQVSGTTPIAMIGPNGEQKQVPISQVDAMRQQKFAIAPQPGVQRMATPDGQLTYALPGEVDKFKASGHVPIQDNGYYQVEPLPGEYGVDTMARAAKIAKNLPPDVIKQGIEAEKKTFTAKRIAANLIGGPVVAGVVLPAAIAGGGELAGAGAEAAPVIKQALTSEPAIKAYTWAGKKVLEGAGLGVGYKILKWTGVL